VGSSQRQRSEMILAEVFENGHVTIKGLAARLGVSEATVRRDLKALAEDKQVKLVHGGAARARNLDYSFHSKSTRNVEAKRAIGALAGELVGDGEQVFLDSGTTCFEMARALKQKRGLAVIVNSARLAMELDTPGVRVIMLGGQYRPERMDTVGPMATAALSQLRGYIAFIGADGMGVDFGLAASDIESAHLYGLAVANARETICLVDHTKFLSPALFRIAGWEAISRVVTDRRPGPEWMEFLESREIEVVYPQATGLRDSRTPQPIH